MPTFSRFQNCLSLYDSGSAYLQPFRSTSGLTFRSGRLYFTGRAQEVSEVELQNLFTREDVEDIDLPKLRVFYSIILSQFEADGYLAKETISISVPALAEAFGLAADKLNQESTARILATVQSYHNIVGVLKGTRNGKTACSYYMVLNFEGYDANTNVVTFSSPYMNYVIRTIYQLSIRKNRSGEPLLKKSGEPLRLATHSYLIDRRLAIERNKAAAENVVIIVQLIEQAGNHVPHIKASTIVERNPQLKERLERSTNKRQLLKTCFTKTWELLRTRTRLQEVYRNIVLPDPKDASVIPNVSTLNRMVFTFPHDGKA